MLLVFSLALAAMPTFEWRGPIEQRAAVEAKASGAFAELTAIYERATANEPSTTERTIVIDVSAALAPSHFAATSLGRMRLRVSASDSVLRHEIAHQFLLSACPQASGDKLFHEAFALSTSGELDAWIDEGYFSSSKAVAILERGESLDTPQARQALARLLADGARKNAVPLAIERRLRACSGGGRWGPMTVPELSSASEPLRADAFIVLSRHSGEVLIKEGDYESAMPFGSTLKPFVAAGSGHEPPSLHVDERDPFWHCGERLPENMALPEALARSCNAYFLAWDKAQPTIHEFGAYGPVLLGLGLLRLPGSIDEAIGLRPTLALSPWAIAQAYRLLARSRPDLINALLQTPRSGTLAGLGISELFDGTAVKSGTVRDPENNVQLGWLVAVTSDHVSVMVQKGKMPRAFAAAFAERLQVVRKRELDGAAAVQVFALLNRSDVELSCDGVFVSLSAAKDVVVLPRGFRAISRVLPSPGNWAMCLGRPFIARFSGMTGRLYAGVFDYSLAPPASSANEPKARKGSDTVFSTTESRYVAGVLQSEDSQITGEAARALGRVILHNVRNPAERHQGRPVCDTTHCQAFLGTPKDAQPPKSIARLAGWMTKRGWLPFSRGGTEPWRAERSLSEVARALGQTPLSLGFDGKAVRTRVLDSKTMTEVDELIACERLRGPLKLLSCPSAATIAGAQVLFSGVGAGHGEGLSVESAKTTKADAEAILSAAYRD